jgi:hypothetical protein
MGMELAPRRFNPMPMGKRWSAAMAIRIFFHPTYLADTIACP